MFMQTLDLRCWLLDRSCSTRKLIDRMIAQNAEVLAAQAAGLQSSAACTTINAWRHEFAKSFSASCRKRTGSPQDESVRLADWQPVLPRIIGTLGLVLAWTGKWRPQRTNRPGAYSVRRLVCLWERSLKRYIKNEPTYRFQDP